MQAMDTDEQQQAPIFQVKSESHKDVMKFYDEFVLREIFKDNHKTENLYNISFCTSIRPNIFATTAGNQFSYFDAAYHHQWVALQANFYNGKLPSKKENLQPIKRNELLSFAWLAAGLNIKAIVGTRGGVVKRFQLQPDAGELKPFQENHVGPVTSIAGFCGGKYAVSLSKNNGELRVWDVKTPDSCFDRSLIATAVWVTPSADEQSVFIGCKNSLQAITIEELDAGCVSVQINLVMDVKQGKNGDLQICKSLSSDKIVLVSVKRSISVWDIKSKSRVSIWRSSEKTNVPESFDVCGTTGVCVLGCAEGAIEIRDVYSGRLYKRIEHRRIQKTISFTHVGISKHGCIIIAGCGAKIFKFSKKYKENCRCEFFRIRVIRDI